MKSKFFRPITIGSATALISITSLVSYAIGLLRDRIIAINFGTSSATDTYNASFIIPDMLFNLFIAGALSAAFLPVFSDYLVKDKKQAMRIANTMLTTATILITLLATISYIYMKSIIPFVFPELTQVMQADIIEITRILLISAILFAISNTLGNILMSYKHFLSYSLSPIFYNLGIILGIIFLREQMGIYSAAVGVIIGAAFHCLIRIIDTFSTDFKFKPTFDIFNKGFIKILKLMIPKSISLIGWQINLYIFAVVGIKLMEGSFAAFNYARNIQSFAVSLFGIAFATAVFPYLTNSISNGETVKYTEHIQKTMQRILFFTVPSMVGIMVLSDDIIEIILGGGVFDANSVALTSSILIFFAISIPFESLVHILARAFYATQNTITPMIINISAMTIIALITIFVAPKLGIEWFSIGFSIGLIFQVIVLLIFLRSRLKTFKIKLFSISLLKTITASTLMAGAIYLSKYLLVSHDNKLYSLFYILVGSLTFFIIAFIIKSEEISSVKYIFGRIFNKKA